ncbi:F0F1 ATP synthase subunit delta [Enterococcus sp. BWT-B8]|uniref:ATP synthase F1 subunit delta n=1 Tax=Enterococcus sp. BWT-B8 TaxID=2885157 RepID=UPI001E644649|nr:ATP synthase F1 subunit delta [Enterococcus sp. BWT-B8]MCB5951879.1 F0F1 ATP synthase subunit delta [Enterococcus sp. BWT-B8]
MKLDKYMVGKRYGKALFELALEKQEADDVYQQLLKLREVYHLVPGIGDILSDARLEPTEKNEIMEQLLKGFSGTAESFLQVVHSYSRMNDMLLMIDEYERRYDDHKSLILGTVITAVPLNREQHRQIEAKAANLLGYEEANLINLIEPKILGGAIIGANYKVIDGSLRRQLQQIEEQLLR